MKASESGELADVARANEIAALKDRALGLRIALAGMRPEKYQDASELKIRTRKAAQLAAVERRRLALGQRRLFEQNRVDESPIPSRSVNRRGRELK